MQEFQREAIKICEDFDRQFGKQSGEGFSLIKRAITTITLLEELLEMSVNKLK